MPQLQEGMKLSTFFSQAFNNPNFDIEYSKIMDSTKVKGNIVISIDPVDFLLMSFNQSGWHSCHTISHHGESRNFGEYVGGIFSYIADSTTMISYRHSGKLFDYQLGRSKFKEYSKNWRELIYFDTKTNAFCSSRQYPREDDTISKAVREMLEEIICDKLKIENQWKVVRIHGSEYAEEYIEDYDFCGDTLHYNDMLHGFNGRLLYNKELNNLDDVNIIVGNDAICPVCGESHITYCSRPMCSECWEYHEFSDDD